MTPANRILCQALLFGAVISGALWWFFPSLHWSVYPILTLIIAGFAYSDGLKDTANRKVVDGD